MPIKANTRSEWRVLVLSTAARSRTWRRSLGGFAALTTCGLALLDLSLWGLLYMASFLLLALCLRPAAMADLEEKAQAMSCLQRRWAFVLWAGTLICSLTLVALTEPNRTFILDVLHKWYLNWSYGRYRFLLA